MYHDETTIVAQPTGLDYKKSTNLPLLTIFFLPLVHPLFIRLLFNFLIPQSTFPSSFAPPFRPFPLSFSLILFCLISFQLLSCYQIRGASAILYVSIYKKDDSFQFLQYHLQSKSSFLLASESQQSFILNTIIIITVK